MKVKVVSGLFGVSVGISSHVLKLVDENFLNSSMVSPALLSAELTKQDCGGTFAMVKIQNLAFRASALIWILSDKRVSVWKIWFWILLQWKIDF